LTRGALFHEVQRRLLAELKKDGLLPLDLGRRPRDLDTALSRCNTVLDVAAAEYDELLAPAIERVWKSEIEDLRTDLRGWLQQVAQNDTDWEPLYFEFSFGLDKHGGRDPASVTEEATLAEGVRLRGSIDLVERHLQTRVLRVTDHKSGKPLESPPLSVGGGRALQPLLYAAAAEQILNSRVDSARLFYATQRGRYEQMGIPVTDRALNVLTRLLEDIDGTISAGFLPPFPDKGACNYCDYRIVCGPYEERRTGKKDSENLEALIEIRSMG
jgi:CRISPR/Cas system-associated exonuclease Cas4 (RecB family)